MRVCWNWRLFAVLLFHFYPCEVRGSDSDVDSERTSADTQISDLKQLTIVPDSNVATTGHSTKAPTLTKQKRCNRDRVGATLAARQNLPSDINLIPKRHDPRQIAKNLCIQCISLNKCKTAEGCRACSLLCKDVVLLKDQTNPTTAQGGGGPVVESAASSEGVIDPEQKRTAPDGPVLGSRARFGEEEACGGHHLATVTTGNVKEMILQMVGVQDIKDILSVSVRATTRSGSVPVAKGPEGPEALLTIFKDELTSAIEAENAANGIQGPPTIEELFFKVLEMVQNSKPEVSHIGATHSEETLPQTQNEELAEHSLNEEHGGSSASQMVTGSRNSRLGTDQANPSQVEKLSAKQMQGENGEFDIHPLDREEEESFLPNDQENSRHSDRVDSGRAEKFSVAHVQEEDGELNEPSLTGEHEAQNLESKTDGAAPKDTSPLGQMQEEEKKLHEKNEALSPHEEKARLESDRLGSTHAEKSSSRQMQEEGNDMLPRFPLAEQPEGFVVPQLANPAIIEGPPPPGMLLGATRKENQTSEVLDDNASPNNLHVEAVDSTEEDLPRYNLADHEGSLVLQVSNISTIGLSSPTGNGMDDSFIPDMEAEASETKPVTANVKDQSIEGMDVAEAKGKEDLPISEAAFSDDIKMVAKSLANQAFNSVEKDDASGTTLGMTPDIESEDSNKNLLGEMSNLKNVEAATSESKAFSTNKSTKIESSATETLDKTSQSGGVFGTLPGPESTDMEKESLGTAGASMLGNKIEESTPMGTVGAASGNEVDDSRVLTLRPNQVVSSSKSTELLEDSKIEPDEKSELSGSTLGSISELKSYNSKTDSPGIVTLENEFEEVAPLGTAVGSGDNSIISSMEILEGKPMSTNREEAVVAAINHEPSQKTSLDAVEGNTSEAILRNDPIPNEETGAPKKEPLDNIEGIVAPETKIDESTIRLKSSLDETVAGAAHGNKWNGPVEPFKHVDGIQSKVSLITTGPNSAGEVVENEMIDSNMNSNRVEMGQFRSSESMDRATLESAPSKEVNAAAEPFLDRYAEASPLEPTVATASGNEMKGQDLEKGGVSTVTGVSSPETILGSPLGSIAISNKETESLVQNKTDDSALQDLEAGVPEIVSQSEAIEKDTLITFRGISGEQNQSGTKVEIGIKNEASESVGATAETLSPDQVLANGNDSHTEPELLKGKFDESSEASMLGNGFEDLSINQVKEASKTASLDTTGGPSGITSPTETFVGAPPENRNEVGASWLQDSTIGHISEVDTMGKEAGNLSSSSPANGVVAAELEGRNDMVAEASENRVMNVVVPDEFLGWSKPSDNPTTINIVIPPKPVPQESANIEKEDLREAEPQDDDEPRGRDQFAELETVDDGEEIDNREAEADDDSETENQVRESDDEENDVTNMNNRNGEFDENLEMEFQFRETDDEAPEEGGQIVEDDAPNNIDEDENEEEAAEVRQADTDDNDETGQTLKENEDSDGDTDRKTSISIKQPESFSRLKKLMQSMQSPQERIASMTKMAKDRSNVGAEAPALTEEGDSTFPKNFARPESKIGKMLEKFRDRLHKSKAEGGTSVIASSARKNFDNQDAISFKNRDSDAFIEEHSDLENDGRLSKTVEEQQQNQDLESDSRLEEKLDSESLGKSQKFTSTTPDARHLNQEVVHTTHKSSDFKFPSINSAILGNGRLSSDSQLKAAEDRVSADSPKTIQSQSDGQQIFKDSKNLSKTQTHSQLQERMNVVNDSPLDFTPGEDLTLQEPDRELALSGVSQNDPLPTPGSTIFGEHFPSTPSLSEIISSAKDKFRKTFEESTRTLGSKGQEGLTGKTLNKNSLPIAGSANNDKSFLSSLKTNPGYQGAPGFDRLLGESTSTSDVTRNNILSSFTGGTDSVNVGSSSLDGVTPFQKALGQVLGDSVSDGESSINRIHNSGLERIDGASVGHTIQEIGRSTGQVIKETSNIIGDTIRNGKQNINNIFGGVNDLASKSNGQQVFGENLGNSEHATLGNNLPTAGITDTTLSQSFNGHTVGDLDGIEKVTGDTAQKISALDKIGIPRANLNRFGQINLDASNQEGVSGLGLTPSVTIQPSNRIGNLNLGKFGNIERGFPATLQPFNRIEEAYLRQPTELSNDYTGLTLPITVNPLKRIVSPGNLKPITDVKNPTNVDDLQPLGNPQSGLIVEPPGLDTSDSSEELKADQTGIPKQQDDGTVKQNQPAVTKGLPHTGKFDVHSPFNIPRNMVNKPTTNPISNFEAAKNALLKLQQLTGRLRKKDGTGRKGASTNEEQPSVTDVVKVLQEISKEVISTAENVSRSKAKNAQPSDPNIVGSQVLENSWENLQPFLPRDSLPLTITKPAFPHQHHVVGMAPSTTLKTPLQAYGVAPPVQKLLDHTSTYHTTHSGAKVGPLDYNIQKDMPARTNQLGNPEPSRTHQIYNAQRTSLPMKNSVTTSNGLIQLPSGFAKDDTNRVGSIQSNNKATKPIPFGFDRELPQSINNMLTPRSDEKASPITSSITASEGLTKLPLSLHSGATKTNYETVKSSSVSDDEVRRPPISEDLSSSIMSSSSSDRVESMQPATKNIEERMNNQRETLPILAARHQNSIAISAETPRDIYFVGTGMKLPLQMVKKEGGEVHLSVDIDKLCSCKNNYNCTKNQSTDGSELKKDQVVGESSSNILAVDGPALDVEKPGSDGFAKRNIPTHRSLRDVDDRYAVEWEIEEPEEAHSDVRLSTDTGDTIGEHRIEIEIDDPIIISKNSNPHVEETSNIKIVNRFPASTDDVEPRNVKLKVGSPQMVESVTVTSKNVTSKNLDAERNVIKKISGIVSSNQASEVAAGSPEMPQDEKSDTSNNSKGGKLPKESSSPYESDVTTNTGQSNRKQLEAKKDETYQYSNPFRRLNYQEVSSKDPLDTTESVASSTEKSTYLSNLLKKLRSRLPTQEPRTVNTYLRSPLVSNFFSQRMRNQEIESPEEPKLSKLSNRLKDHNVDRYSNLALRNRLFPTLGRQKEPLAKLEKTADDEKEAPSIEDENKEEQGTGIMRNFLSWFKNLNNKQKR